MIIVIMIFSYLGETQKLVYAQDVLNLQNFNKISAGDFTAVALKSDGTVWTWGSNKWGQLGDGTNISADTPTKSLINLGPQMSTRLSNIEEKPTSSNEMVNGKNGISGINI